jgi:hypothetical protein
VTDKSTTLDEAFNTDTEEGSKPIEILPVGKYVAEATNASYGELKSGKGSAVELCWTIVEGEYENRLVFQTVILQHESEKAKAIGRGMFKDICVSCGITGPVTDLSVLLYKKVHLRVGVEKDKTGEYGDKNRVKRVDPYIAPWNGAKPAAVLKEASATKPAFEASKEVPDDAIPF